MKKTITQHMKLSRAQRQAHTNTSSACIEQTGKSRHHGGTLAKEALIKYHNIEKFNGIQHKVHTCHLCKNDSMAPNDFVCINPLHLYFGTVSENCMDKTPENRKAGGKIGGKKGARVAAAKALKKGNHISQQQVSCPHCSMEGNIRIMKRWHFDRCKHKPMA